MQEIFPLKPTGPEELISPPSFGELSRRLPSLFAVQNRFPRRNGLVGNSRILSIVVADRISQSTISIHWISENFSRYALSKDSDCISLIDGGPDISVLVQSNAVNSLKARICDKDVI